MRKKLSALFFLCSLVSMHCYSQITGNFYYDAKTLNTCKATNFFQIFWNYCDGDTSFAELKNRIEVNPFLIPFKQEVDDKFDSANDTTLTGLIKQIKLHTVDISNDLHSANNSQDIMEEDRKMMECLNDTVQINNMKTLLKDSAIAQFNIGIIMNRLDSILMNCPKAINNQTNSFLSISNVYGLMGIKDTISNYGLVLKTDSNSIKYCIQAEVRIKKYLNSIKKENGKYDSNEYRILKFIDAHVLKMEQSIVEVLSVSNNLLDNIKAIWCKYKVIAIKDLAIKNKKEQKTFNDYTTLINDAFKKNGAFIKSLPSNNTALSSKINTANTHSSSGLTGGSLESAVIDGTAKFIADRFKQELTAYFFELLKGVIDSNQTIHSLFPQTTQLFDIKDPYSFTNKISLVQNAFQNDLSNILSNIDNWEHTELASILNKDLFIDSTGRSTAFVLLEDLLKQLSSQSILILHSDKIKSNTLLGSAFQTNLKKEKLKLNAFLLNLPKYDTAAIREQIELISEEIAQVNATLPNRKTLKTSINSEMKKVLYTYSIEPSFFTPQFINANERKNKNIDTAVANEIYNIGYNLRKQDTLMKIKKIKFFWLRKRIALKKERKMVRAFDTLRGGQTTTGEFKLLVANAYKKVNKVTVLVSEMKDTNKPRNKTQSLLIDTVKSFLDKKVATLYFWNKILNNETMQHIHFFLSLYNELRTDRDPAEAVSVIMDSSFVSTFTSNKEVISSCRIVKTISDGLRINKMGHIGWISVDSINLLTDKEKLYVLALMYEKLRNIRVDSGNIKLGTIENTITRNKGMLNQYFIELSETFTDIQETMLNFKNITKKDSLTPGNILKLYNRVSNMITEVYTNPLLGFKNASIVHNIEKMDSITNSMIQIYSDVSHKYWDGIVGDGITLVQQIAGNDFKASETIVKYGTFFSSVAEAKNSDDIEMAIENIALPPGSYSIKRKTICNVAINAYAGIDYNFNLFTAEEIHPLYLSNIGFSAPVGISFSWGYKDLFGVFQKKKKQGSTTIFVSLVDLGALVQFRLGNDTASSVPKKVTFNQVLSPGIFYIYGFRKCPFSLELGADIRPQLAQSFETNLNLTTTQVRFTAGILVDIPLLDVYSKVPEIAKP